MRSGKPEVGVWGIRWGQNTATEQSENCGPLTETWLPEADSMSTAGKAGKMSGYTKARFSVNVLSLLPR